MAPVCKEESFHQRQGFEAMSALANGTPAQRKMAQDALDRRWWPALMTFGPSDYSSPNSAQSMALGIKRFSNDELRQRFVDAAVPQAEHLGLTVPDRDPEWDEESGRYRFGEIDCTESYEVMKGDDPCNRERIRGRVGAHAHGAWVREAAAAYADKQAARAAGSAAA
jgi:ring-1,2-phenylacetyl-CoA epoxidase subunit PaaA